MELRDIVLADKSDIKVGPWHSGKVPKADFPIAKNAYRLGSLYEWCVITFEALGVEVRVLVVLNPGKKNIRPFSGRPRIL